MLTLTRHGNQLKLTISLTSSGISVCYYIDINGDEEFVATLTELVVEGDLSQLYQAISEHVNGPTPVSGPSNAAQMALLCK
jgi:hypothetical protein